MLGRLSRWLRMLGCDIKYYSDASDDILLSIAADEDCVLLTSDAELFQRACGRGLKSLFVEGGSEVERLASVARRFNIRLEVDMSISRCPTCGSTLHSREKETILEKIPSGTLRHYNEFWVCDGCRKIYWQGAHWKKINETLNKAKMLLETGTHSAYEAR